MREDSITASQRGWLYLLQSLSKRPLRVSRNFEGKPSKWVSIEDAEFPVDYRTILHNEVVFDIDSTKWKEVRLFTEIVTDTLNKMNVPYITAYTGGRGVHIHVFFDLSEDQKEQCIQIDVMPKDLRIWLFQRVLQEAGVSPKLIGPGKALDNACVNWSDEGKGHLVRIFGGKKRQHKTLLSDVPEERPKDDIVFPVDIERWKIPDNLFQEFIEHFKGSQKERIEASKRYHKASANFTGKYLNLPCVQKVLGGLPEGQRNAGARIAAIACRLDGVPTEDAEKILLEYAKNCSQENISESEYLGWVSWIYAQSKTFWNCRFCKDLELCEQQKCNLHESAFRKEHDFLKDKNLLQNASRIMGKKIKREEKNKLVVLSVYLSAYGSNPLNLFLKGESSIGKTYLAKTVAEYFPEEDVWFIGDMSPKALIHEHGRFENGKMYVSLENKILVFLETPRRQTLEMLKPILSHDRREIEYKVADKSSAGKLQTKSVIIQGWPATIFCTTDFKYLEELSTRSLLTTPETTQEKIAEVLQYKGRKYSRPWEEMEVDEDEEIFKNALKLLRSPKGVCVPYADELAQLYSKTEPRVMRDYDKLMELIKMSAFLHQKQRPSFEVESSEGTKHYVIATECDYKIGMHLFEHIRETTVTGLAQPIIDFFEKVICQLDEITYASMMKEFKHVYGKLVGRDQMRRKYIDPLETVGWLNRGKDAIDGRVVTFEKCINEEENTQKTRLSTSLVLKDIFSEDSVKEYLDRIEKKCEKNKSCKRYIVYADERLEGKRCDWFYCDENLVYFSEQKEIPNEELDEETEVKNKSRVNAYNSDEKNVKCGISEDNLIDLYDEETVLLQIPQEDTKIEDVTNKFKDHDNVLDAIAILREKKKVILGQGYIRRPSRLKDKITQYDEETMLQMIPQDDTRIQDFVNKFENPNRVVDTLAVLEKKGKIIAEKGFMRKLSSTPGKKDSDYVNRSRPNTWRCGMCGKRFQAHIPDEDYDGNAICGTAQES